MTPMSMSMNILKTQKPFRALRLSTVFVHIMNDLFEAEAPSLA